jgi:hypothetical protein
VQDVKRTRRRKTRRKRAKRGQTLPLYSRRIHPAWTAPLSLFLLQERNKPEKAAHSLLLLQERNKSDKDLL